MKTTDPKGGSTPQDLLRMPDGDCYELVNGILVVRETGACSSYVGGRLFCLMSSHCEQNPPGWFLPAGCGYQCFSGSPNTVRKPRVSFIAFGRLPNELIPEGHITIAPDLAAEVLSPNDLDYETDQKVEEYLRAGVRLVWVINPETRTVLIYRADGSINGLREHDELKGENVLPGFSCRVSDLFRTPAPATPAGSN